MWHEYLRPYLRFAKIRYQLPSSPFLCDDGVGRTLRDLSYVEQWQLSREKGWYHLYLEDHSFLSFDTTHKASYVFFDHPIDVPSFSDYVAERGLPPRRSSFDELRDDYDQLLQTAPLRKNVTPIRYDFDPDAYRRGVHPAAHIHIGLDNDIRIGLKRELSPIAFFLFVVRQMYPSNWEHLIESPTKNVLARRIRAQLVEIDAAMLSEEDECEMYLV